MNNTFTYENITLINADCHDVMGDFGDGYFELAVVDPPFEINLISQKFVKPSRPNSYIRPPKHKEYEDKRPDKHYFNQLFRVSKNQIIWGATNLYDLLPLNDSWIFWNKINGEGSHFADGEFAFTSFSCSSRMVTYSQHHGTRGGKERIHLNQKPVALYTWLLQNYSTPSDKILDTHGGSFSSAIAAYRFGCKEFIGIEKDKDYFQAAVKRFKQQVSQLDMFHQPAKPINDVEQLKMF